MAHPVADHIDRAVGLLPAAQFRQVNEALKDLLTEVHEDAVQDRAARVIGKVEMIAAQLGLDITHYEEG